ncbi:MAG: hypothetical protein QNK30_01045 [Bacteroidales bacterium]|nr:hypothetical protein [Bacteroidales bacterium]
MKKVLVVSYSQSGQLEEIVQNVLTDLRKDESIYIHHERLKPIPDFHFPWKDIGFWDAMPESVRMIPAALEPYQFDPADKFDLIILGYPIWFLSPPIPLNTFLQSPEAARLMINTPVITIIGSRNMWVGAQEDIKKQIAVNQGILCGNISLRDRHHNLPSVVTIIYWMLTGKKDRYLGIFPYPGVSEKDIAEATRFGLPIRNALANSKFENLQDELLEMKSVELLPDIVSMELKGKRIFKLWSAFILKKGGPGSKQRVGRLKLFKWYLLFVIFVVSPLASLIYYLSYPFFVRRIKRNLKYYKGVALR